MDTYSTKDLCEKTNMTRQNLSNLRNGYTNSGGYLIKPRLIEGEDWEWQKGKIVYFKIAIDKLMNNKKGRKKKEIS